MRTLIAAADLPAQTPRQRTYANPIDIDYRYNFEQQNEGISYRSGADPVIVVHRGEYYLFETIGDGYWRSRDLGTWRHVTPSRWPLTDIVAPAALSVRDTIYLLPSTTRPLPIMMLTQPATGRVEFYNRLLPWLPMARDREPGVFAKPDSVQPGPWDPQFFHDPATERWFLYWNSSNAYPLHVIELDKSKRLAYKGTPRWLLGLEPEKHGWERYPVAYKPGGFVQGAGHGNTFQDVHGNWWNTSTPWIGVNWNFERRIGLHPAGFDEDGQMYVDTRFGDFPHWHYKSGLFGTDSTVVTQFRLRVSDDGLQWRTVADLARERRDRPNAYVELSTPARARFVRYEHVHVAAANLAVSDIRVFGTGTDSRPATPPGLTARRERDERNATITWNSVPGIVGYNVRWGISPSKLYQTFQRFADQGRMLELRALTVAQAYWAAIESFDENGVSTLSPAVPIR